MQRIHTTSTACLATLLTSLAAHSPAVAQTTRLTFSGPMSSVSGWDVLHGYGDRVDGPTAGGYSYEGVGAYTPNVLVNIGGAESGQLLEPQVWTTGYSELVDVLYLQPLGLAHLGAELQVTLSADPGYGVSLRSFDLGNYGGALTLPYIRVLDEGGALVHEETQVLLPPYSSSARRFTLGTGAVGRILQLRISLAGLQGRADHVALDNLTFSQHTAAPIEVGASYCSPAITNSSGGPGALRAWGDARVAQNDLRLVATGLPFGSVGFCMASTTDGFVARPAGSAGNLCLGGAIGRFVAPGQVRATGTTGHFALRIDLTWLPSPTGAVAAQAGETWRFQAWYRDSINGVATSNFTDALAIAWQ